MFAVVVELQVSDAGAQTPPQRLNQLWISKYSRNLNHAGHIFSICCIIFVPLVFFSSFSFLFFFFFFFYIFIVPSCFSSLGEQCFIVKLQKCFANFETSPDFPSTRGWEHNDWVFICAQTFPLRTNSLCIHTQLCTYNLIIGLIYNQSFSFYVGMLVMKMFSLFSQDQDQKLT